MIGGDPSGDVAPKLRVLIAEYTREAGVRSLERQLGTIARKVAARVASRTGAEADTSMPRTVVDREDVDQYLGVARFKMLERVRQGAVLAVVLRHGGKYSPTSVVLEVKTCKMKVEAVGSQAVTVDFQGRRSSSKQMTARERTF